MKKEIRKVIYNKAGINRFKAYQLLKPKEDGKWHRYGRQLTLSGLCKILDSKKYDVFLPEEIKREITEYRKEREEKREKYYRDIESKVI